MSVITPRDRKLFHRLGKYGLLTTSQLSLQVFPGVDHSTVLRRLRALEKGKWIYRIQALETGERVWLLSRQGENEIGLGIPMIKPNRNGVAHDVLLTDFRISFDAIGLGQNFVPEWTIRRQTYDRGGSSRNDERVVPDGIFSAAIWNNNLVTVSVELEINGKNLSRYEKIFTKYMNQSHLDLVWYFVKSRSFGELLQARWKYIQSRKYAKNNMLVFTVIDDFKRDPRKAPIYFPSGNPTSVEQYFKLSETAQAPAQPVGRVIQPKNETETMKTAS